MTRLTDLYRKTRGGQRMLSDSEYIEYAALRETEFQTQRDKLVAAGCTDVRPIKDDTNDITGWTFTKHD